MRSAWPSLLALFALVLPAPAIALRCAYLSSDQIAATWAKRAEALAVRGQLTYAPGQAFGDPENGLDLALEATLIGREVTVQGFGPERTFGVIHRVQCSAPWCQGPIYPDGIRDGLFLLDRFGGRFVLDTGVCQDARLDANSPVGPAFRQCLRGEASCQSVEE